MKMRILFCIMMFLACRNNLEGFDGIKEKSWPLTPGAYVGVAPVEDDGVDFHERMAEIHEELLKLQEESNRLMEAISKDMEEMGI